MSDPRRRIPRIDDVLADPRIVSAVTRLGDDRVRRAVREAQQRARDGEVAPEAVADVAVAQLPASASSLRPVLNATGVVLHTNLGRAALSDAATTALHAAAGYVDVEFDLASGARSRRGAAALAALRQRVPLAEDVHIVNNGAAALFLAAIALAPGREIVVSRGELVEIGDGFRLPDLLVAAGSTLREVGTTNRTHLDDYREAIGEQTGVVLKIHPSNFFIEGFTAEVDVRALAGLPELAALGIPLVADIGSGLLARDDALPAEPDVASWLADGADLVTASGDKLLGGPQSGLIFGRKHLVAALRRSPAARAMRVDKLTLAALEATLAGPPTPTWSSLHVGADELASRCELVVANVLRRLLETAPHAPVAELAVVPSTGVVGGGGAPGLTLPGWAIELPERCTAMLRCGSPSVVARTERGRCVVDLRCVPPSADADVTIALVQVLSPVGEA